MTRFYMMATLAFNELIGLLKQSDVNDERMNNVIKNINLECDICARYRKPKPKPTVAFPLAKTFNEIIALDLKHWSHSPKVCLLCS